MYGNQFQHIQKIPWRTVTGDYNPFTDPVSRLTRHERTTDFKLRTGHCRLGAHQKRFGTMDSALCDCKEADDTPHPPYPLAAAETLVMATGRDNRQRAVGNGGRPAEHHPISSSMWTERRWSGAHNYEPFRALRCRLALKLTSMVKGGKTIPAV